MLLSPIVEDLNDDLRRAIALGSEETRRAGEVLIEALGSAFRLRLLDALQQAAGELEASLPGATIELKLQGLDPVLSVSTSYQAMTSVGDPPAGPQGDAEMARITLRLPEALKTQVERAASRDAVSVNSWLVDAASRALQLPGGPKRGSKRMTGFVRG